MQVLNCVRMQVRGYNEMYILDRDTIEDSQNTVAAQAYCCKD